MYCALIVNMLTVLAVFHIVVVVYFYCFFYLDV